MTNPVSIDWRPIRTAPPNGEEILIRSQGIRVGRTYNGDRFEVPCSFFHIGRWTAYDNGEGGRFCNLYGSNVINATHWAPLTEPEQLAVAA